MIEWMKLENFKGFDRIEITGMKPITLISGKNNVGKSSVLEAIFLFMDHAVPDSFVKLNQLRGIMKGSDPANFWEPLFFGMDTKRKIKITMVSRGVESVLEYGRDDSFVPVNDRNLPQEVMNQVVSAARSSYTLRFHFKREEYEENGHYTASPAGIMRNITTTLSDNYIEPMRYTSFINSSIIDSSNAAEWLGKLELEGKKQQVIDALRILEPTIQDLTTIVISGQAQIYAKMESGLLPLKLVGDGMNRLLYLVMAIISYPQSIFLIDEIETGFHYSMYQKLWKIFAQSAYEQGSQIIATTHSYECIAAAADAMAAAELNGEFCYIRIDKTASGCYARRYSDDLLRTAVEAEMEVR